MTKYKMTKYELNEFQKEILQEALRKKSGGLSVPMGSGKTLISLKLGLTLSPIEPILIVVSKTLIENWKGEIKKFFGDDLKFQVLHSSTGPLDSWKLENNTRIVITTPDVIQKYYAILNIEGEFIRYVTIPRWHNAADGVDYVVHYCSVKVPLRPSSSLGADCLFSYKWGTLIVDEIQKYTNCTTKRCRGIASICADFRWGLSGTMFDEPTTERILGYHIILNLEFPRSLPEAQLYLTDQNYRGIRETLVYREKNNAYTPGKLNEVIISHDLSLEETLIYVSLKGIMVSLQKEAKRFYLISDIENGRRFTSYLLTLIIYLRQTIITPLLPIANAILDIADFRNQSCLSRIMSTEIKKLSIDYYLDDPKSVISTRIGKVIETVKKHKNEKLIIFTCFRTTIDLLLHLLKPRRLFCLKSVMTSDRRGDELKKFEESESGVLLLSYELGSDGLNLQCCHTVLLIDLWWNAGKTQQAIARVLRYGQLSDVVNVYYFTSNTGIEKAVYEKHREKLIVLDELLNGPIVSKVKTMSTKEIVKIIEKEDNANLLRNIRQ